MEPDSERLDTVLGIPGSHEEKRIAPSRDGPHLRIEIWGTRFFGLFEIWATRPHRNADEADQLVCSTAKHHRVESETIYRETVRNLDR